MLEVVDDHTIRPKGTLPSSIEFYEWIPGGENVLTDNFNDTGRIDEEPRKPDRRTDGVLTRIVRNNLQDWYQS